MRAWGPDPFDNESALDWASGLRTSKALAKDIREALHIKRDGHDEIRAAAYLIPITYNANILNPADAEHLTEQAIEALEKILADEAWVSSWKDSGAIQQSIQRQIRELKEIQELI